MEDKSCQKIYPIHWLRKTLDQSPDSRVAKRGGLGGGVILEEEKSSSYVKTAFENILKDHIYHNKNYTYGS